MNLKEAIEILDYHQSWRLGKIDEIKFSSRQITEALDVVLDEVKKNNKVSKLDELFERLSIAISKKHKVDIITDPVYKNSWIGKEDELNERVLRLESEINS